MILESLPGYCLGPLAGLAVNFALALLCLITNFIYAGYRPLPPLCLFYLTLTGYFLGMTVWELQSSPLWISRGYMAMLISLAWLPASWLNLVGSLAERRWTSVLRLAVAAGAILTLLLLTVEHPLVLGPRLLLHLDGRTLRPESLLVKPLIYFLDLAALFISVGFLLRPSSWPGGRRPAWVRAVLAGLALWLLGGGNDILHAMDLPWALDPPVLWIASIWLSLCLAGAVSLHLRGLEEAVRGSEEKYRNILSSIHEGYYEVDLKGDLTFFNQALCRITGYEPEEMLGLGNRAYMDPETSAQVYRVFNQVARSDRTADSLEWPLIRKNGSRCFVEMSVSALRGDEGRVIGFRGMARDVTQRKLAEAKVLEKQAQLRTLAKEVIRVEESERRRIAQDLHDGVGQYLLASKLRLEQLALKAPPEIMPDVNLAISLVQQSLADTRSLTSQLCPPALWELGLGQALSWLAEQARERYGLEVSLEMGGDRLNLDEQSQAALFRSASELLLNVAKHAQASRVMISLRREDHNACLRVWDNGKGLQQDAGRKKDKSGGLGLFSIRERMELLGGSLALDLRPGQGARVALRLPLAPEGETSGD